MQMLAAGGMKCAGDFPAYEPPETNHGAMPEGWLWQWRGAAVKLLDPHYSPVEKGIPCAVIWMSRNLKQQAKSQIKFAMAMMGREATYSRAQVYAMRDALQKETKEALRGLDGFPVLYLQFEKLLADSFQTAREIISFLGGYSLGLELDARKMSAAILKRDAECADGLDVELELVRRVPRLKKLGPLPDGEKER